MKYALRHPLEWLKLEKQITPNINKAVKWLGLYTLLVKI